MAKDLSKDKACEQVTNAFLMERACNPTKLVCTSEQASHLLGRLGKTYQALASGDQEQVKAFIRECQRYSQFLTFCSR